MFDVPCPYCLDKELRNPEGSGLSLTKLHCHNCDQGFFLLVAESNDYAVSLTKNMLDHLNAAAPS